MTSQHLSKLYIIVQLHDIDETKLVGNMWPVCTYFTDHSIRPLLVPSENLWCEKYQFKVSIIYCKGSFNSYPAGTILLAFAG